MTRSTALSVTIVGYGSIGMRHAKILRTLGCSVSVVSKRLIGLPKFYADLQAALLVEHPEIVVVANETSKHHCTMKELNRLEYRGVVLIEKPIFDVRKERANNTFRKLLVAYNLRFHPVIQQLKKKVFDKKIISVSCYAGQYLPGWRPDRDYRDLYSASLSLGGGVLRDLSHELDYLSWIFGKWVKLTAIGGKFSDLEINSDDMYSILFSTTLCPAINLELNYLDKKGRRSLVINESENTLEIDLINGKLINNNNEEVFSVSRDDTYINMWNKILNDDTEDLCSYEEASELMEMISAIEYANKQSEWVVNDSFIAS